MYLLPNSSVNVVIIYQHLVIENPFFFLSKIHNKCLQFKVNFIK